jgi:2-phosphosulfolactate phosphatase
MIVKIHKGLSGCKNANGIAVIIDVFRASTTICCLLQSNPQKLIIGRDIQYLEGFIDDKNYECFSEIKTSKKHQDNSPLKAFSLSLKNKKAIIVSRNGTVAINAVRHCKRVFVASFVNVDAIVEYIRKIKPEEVSIIAIGHINRDEETDEDNLCAEMIHNCLLDIPVNEFQIRKKLAKRIKERLLDPESPQGDEVNKDIALCTAIGILNVVPEVSYDGNVIHVVDALIVY